MRAHFDRVAAHARESSPPPSGGGREALLYGMAQPFLGLRVLLATPHLRRRAILPMLIVLGIAAFTAVGELGDDSARGLQKYYGTITSLASLPAFLFANSYARLVADAHAVLGFGERAPLLTRLWPRFKHLVRAAILLALAIAPLTGVLQIVPLAGDVLVAILGGVWTVYWMVVEALDEARVAQPSRADETAHGMAAAAGPTEAPPPLPWFVGWTAAPLVDRLPGLVRRPIRWFGRMISRLARPWAEENALVRRHVHLGLGFGLATAALLAIPVANLFLRPAILVGAVHLRAWLQQATADPSQTGRGVPSDTPTFVGTASN